MAHVFKFLRLSGLRAGDVAMLRFGNIDLNGEAIKALVRKVGRIHEFPLAKPLIDLLDPTSDPSQPLFPTLYAKEERRLNDNLA